MQRADKVWCGMRLFAFRDSDMARAGTWHNEDWDAKAW
jgi:hypothetical protein